MLAIDAEEGALDRNEQTTLLASAIAEIDVNLEGTTERGRQYGDQIVIAVRAQHERFFRCSRP